MSHDIERDAREDREDAERFRHGLVLSPAEADLVRQWFSAVEDMNSAYLHEADKELLKRIVAFQARTYDMEHPKTCRCELCRAWGA